MIALTTKLFLEAVTLITARQWCQGGSNKKEIPGANGKRPEEGEPPGAQRRAGCVVTRVWCRVLSQLAFYRWKPVSRKWDFFLNCYVLILCLSNMIHSVPSSTCRFSLCDETTHLTFFWHLLSGNDVTWALSPRRVLYTPVECLR